MKNQDSLKTINPVKQFFINYAVPILFIIMIVFAAPMS